MNPVRWRTGPTSLACNPDSSTRPNSTASVQIGFACHRLSVTQAGGVHPADAALALESARGSVEGSGSAALGADFGRFSLLSDEFRHIGIGRAMLLRSEEPCSFRKEIDEWGKQEDEGNKLERRGRKREFVKYPISHSFSRPEGRSSPEQHFPYYAFTSGI